MPMSAPAIVTGPTGGGRSGGWAGGPIPVAVLNWPAIWAAGGGGGRAAGSTVSAFDRPTPVIVMGPLPLPVTGGGGPGKTPPAPKESGGGSAWAMVKAFGRVAGPLLTFGAVLGQANSGASTLGKATSVLAASLAPILMPPLVVMAAGVLTVSDIVWTKLRPNLSAFAAVVVERLVPAVQKLIDLIDRATGGSRSDYTVAAATGGAAWLANRGGGSATAVGGTGAAAAGGGMLARAGGFLGRFASRLPGAALVAGGVGDQMSSDSFYDLHRAGGRGKIMSFLGAAINETTASFGLSDRQRRKTDIRLGYGMDPYPGAPRGPDGQPGPYLSADQSAPVAGALGGRAPFLMDRAADLAGPGGGGGGMEKNLNLVLTSLTRSLLPKAEYTTGAAASKARQLAGANADPLDALALRRMLEGLQEELRGVRTGVERLNGPTPQVPPNGGG